MVLSAWDNSKEWTAVMDEGEEIQVLANKVSTLVETYCLSAVMVSSRRHRR